MMLQPELIERLEQMPSLTRITVVTGAGISAESGIPTFRGPEGYWTRGSREYHPQQMATHAMYRQMPDDVWGWYLYRRTVCRRAEPNIGHQTITRLTQHVGSGFNLITQNVDGLHRRAGTPPARIMEVHGNIDLMRCENSACATGVHPIPETLGVYTRNQVLQDADRGALSCPRCGQLCRPHVLWFDETYNEEYFRFESALAAAYQTELLIVIGSSGSTNLPLMVTELVLQQGGLMIDINPEWNHFTDFALAADGFFIQAPSSVALPALADLLIRIVA